MDDGVITAAGEDYCTLLCVRADGIAPFVDLTPWTELSHIQARAQGLLREHASCEAVEVWRGGLLLERIARA